MPIALLTVPTRAPGDGTYPTDQNTIIAKINEVAAAMSLSALTISAAVGAGNPAADTNTVVAKVNQLVGVVNAPPATTGIVDVYVISGQSNAEGGAAITDITSLAQLAPLNLGRQFARCKIWNYTTGVFEPLRIGGHSAPGNQFGYTLPANLGEFYGPEASIADILETTTTRTVYLLKYAYGGTSIDLWQTGGQYRPRLDQTVNDGMAALTALGYTPTIRGILWSQGEADSGTAVSTYQGKLNTLFTSFYNAWLPAAAKVAITLLRPAFDTGGNIRAAQLAYIATNAHAAPLYPDAWEARADVPIHYNGLGQYRQGAAFLAALAAPSFAVTVTPTPAPGTFTGLAFDSVSPTVSVSNGSYITSGTGGGFDSHGSNTTLKTTVGIIAGVRCVAKAANGNNCIAGFRSAASYGSGYALDFGVFIDANSTGTLVGIHSIVGNNISGVLATPTEGATYDVLIDAAGAVTMVETLPSGTRNILATLGTTSTVFYAQFHLANFPAAGLATPQQYGLS